MSGGTSYNGWPCNSDPNAIDIVPFGAGPISFPQGMRAGDVSTVLGYVFRQIHERVEACVPGWNWGYSYKENANNPGSLSCHASGTAGDYNAPNHGNGATGTWSSAQVAEIRKILDEVGGAVQWGEDYTGTVDGMHFEIIVDAAALARVAADLPAQPEDDEVNSDDIEAIADAVIDRMRNDKIVSYNKTDAGSGKETQTTGSITGALGTAATYAGRAAYRATEADHQTE